MKLQLLVPQYKETDEIIKPLLDSLMIQQNVDFNEFGVIIVNDGTDIKLSDKLLNSYPYKIDYYQAPHRGVSATRNTCLDYANADYVMFCDADDMFFNACGLYLIFREIDIGFDTLSSKFIEDGRLDNNQIIYINHEKDSTFVHGKIHRRQYLIDNNIRWNPNLTIHEDSYFNILCQSFTNQPKYLNESFYLWKWREGSVCRSDPEYILKTYSCLIDGIDALIDFFENKGKHDKAVYYTCYMILNVYYNLWKPQWKAKNNLNYRNKVELRIYQFYTKYFKNWIEMSESDKLKLATQYRNTALNEGMEMEELTLKQWIDRLVNTYKDIQ